MTGLRSERGPNNVPIEVKRWVDEDRIDALAKVTGTAAYLADLPPLRGEARVAMLRSPHAHARIVHLDSSRALALPGVLDVLDRTRLGAIKIHEPVSEYLKPHDGQPGTIGGKHVVCQTKALFDGDIIAMVAAEDEETAQLGLSLIEVEYEPLPAVFSFEEAVADGSPILHDELGTNLAFEDSLEWGDVERALENAEYIFEEDFYGGNAFHHPMEPSNSCVVRVVDDEVDIWTSVHQAFIAGEHVERILGISRGNVRVRIPYIGGGFGAKQVTPELLGTVELARRVGRPLRYLATEEDSFRTTSRHAMRYRARIGVDGDGTLRALDVNLDVDTGAYFTGAALVSHNACISAWGCYRIPAYRARAMAVFTNKVPAGSFRATGKNQTTFGIECALDSVARQLGIDPVEFRRRNVLKRGEYPARYWSVRGERFRAEVPAIDTDFGELIDAAQRAVGWHSSDVRAATDDRHPAAEKPEVLHGRGLALSLRHGAQGGGRAHAMVEMNREGRLRVVHNAPELGTGVFTIIAVTVAHALEVDQNDVEVLGPDTANSIPFRGTSAQRTTVQMGNAVLAACENLKRELAEAAAQTFGGQAAEWRVAGGQLWRGNEHHTFAEALELHQDDFPMRAVGSYSYAPSADKAFGGLDHWAPGVVAVELEVDVETGTIRLLKLCGVADAGKAIHRVSAARQVEGGAVLGIGLSLTEELLYEDGQLQNGHIIGYRMPLIGDMPPRFTSVIIEHGDGPGPFGAKGLSQVTLPCVAPAIAAAVRDATGVWVRSTPLTPEKVFRAMHGNPFPTDVST